MERLTQQEAERMIALLTNDYIARRKSEQEKMRQLENEKRQLKMQLLHNEDSQSAIRARVEDLKFKLSQDKSEILAKVDFNAKGE